MKSRATSVTPKPKKAPRQKFLYQLEYAPNPDCIQVHARVRFPKNDTMDMLDLRYNTKDKKKRHPLYAALAKIQGLQSAHGGGYTLQVLKANHMFDWEKLIPKVLAAIQTTVAGKRVMTPFGPPKRPSSSYLASLRVQGCDV